MDESALGRVLTALGGRENIVEARLAASRVCLELRDPARVDEATLIAAVRAVARPTPGSVHLVLGPAAAAWHARLTV